MDFYFVDFSRAHDLSSGRDLVRLTTSDFQVTKPRAKLHHTRGISRETLPLFFSQKM